MPAHTTLSPDTHEVVFRQIFASGSDIDQVLDDLLAQYQATTGILAGKPGTDERTNLCRFETVVDYDDETGNYAAVGTWYLAHRGAW
jgi:hypothetical protein